MQKDGKLIATGITRGISGPDSLLLCSLMPGGKPDNSFGINGNVILSLDTYFGETGSYLSGEKLALQQDNKIIVAVRIYTKNGLIPHIGVLRFNTDGSLDDSFGNNGITTLNIEDLLPNDYFKIQQIQILRDGKILLLAWGYYGDIQIGSLHYMLCRYNTDGTSDPSFGNGGIVIHDKPFIRYFDQPVKIIQLHDNSFIVAGYSKIEEQPEWYIDNDLFFAKHNYNGSIDKNFANKGVQMIKNEQDISEYMNDAAMLADSSIIIKGYCLPTKEVAFYSYNLKLKSNFTIDSSFAINGADTTIAYEGCIPCRGYKSIIPLSGDRFVAAGIKENEGIFPGYKSQIARHLGNNGSLDESFGNIGQVWTLYDTSNLVMAQSLDNDEKITALFENQHNAGKYRYQSDFLFARYNSAKALAIALSFFNAVKKENTSFLQWHTCSEVNSKGFSVERSGDNKSYIPIGFIAAKGGGNKCNNNYEFIDNTPQQGINYYRLKVLDHDGKFSYTNIENLSFNILSAIKISPNPAKDILKIEGLNKPGGYALKIADINGKTIQSIKVSMPVYNMDVSSLPEGTYFLAATDTTGIIQTVRLIKE